MANKEFKGRIRHKTDRPDNWEKATAFSPLDGELIIYKGERPKLKIGDGETNVNDLPFVGIDNIYVGEDEPEDPDISVWIDTNEELTPENITTGLPTGGEPLQSITMGWDGTPVWEDAPWRYIFEAWNGFGIEHHASTNMSIVDKLKTMDLGLYTLYVQKGCPDNPPGAVAINSSLRGIANVSTAKGDTCYAWILLWDQASNCYMRYVQNGVAAPWKQLNVPVDSTLTVEGAAADAKAVGEALAAGGSGSAGIYVGPEEPENPDIKVWIDDDGEADPVIGAAISTPELISDETIEITEGETLSAYAKELGGRYKRINVLIICPENVSGAKYFNIWNENVEAVKGANAAKSLFYFTSSHLKYGIDVTVNGVMPSGFAGSTTSADGGVLTTTQAIAMKAAPNEHVTAVYAMKYITGFSVCFAIPSGTRVVVYGWPYDDAAEALSEWEGGTY